MRFVASVILSVFIFIASGSWHFDVHLCHNEIESISLNHGANEGCDANDAICGNCCDDVHLEFENDADYLMHHFEYKLDLFSVFSSPSLPQEILGTGKESNYLFGSNSSPPHEKLYLKHAQLIFYG